MFRMLVTDIDDTLLAHDGSLPAVNHEALERLHRSGIVIVFASGRADSSIQSVASRILPPEDDEYYISFNGARVVTAASREIVTKHYVGPDAIRDVIRYTREHHLHIQGYVGDQFLFEKGRGAESQFGSDYRAAADAYAKATGQQYAMADDLVESLPDGSPKLLIIADHEVLVAHRDRINELSEGRIRAMFSKPRYLEIVAAGVSKGHALAELAARLGIGINETLAIGDGDNDAEMLEAAGTGVAVANARERAKAAADVVLETSASDGAMAEVERRFFGEP